VAGPVDSGTGNRPSLARKREKEPLVGRMGRKGRKRREKEGEHLYSYETITTHSPLKRRGNLSIASTITQLFKGEGRREGEWSDLPA